MGHEAGEKSECAMIHREQAAPILPGRMPLGDEMVGMVERHQDDDQTAQRIHGEQTICFGLDFRVVVHIQVWCPVKSLDPVWLQPGSESDNLSPIA